MVQDLCIRIPIEIEQKRCVYIAGLIKYTMLIAVRVHQFADCLYDFCLYLSAPVSVCVRLHEGLFACKVASLII